jgi:hypothetical protein
MTRLSDSYVLTKLLTPVRQRSISMRSFGNGGECSIRTGRSCIICAAPVRSGVKSMHALSRISRPR